MSFPNAPITAFDDEAQPPGGDPECPLAFIETIRRQLLEGGAQDHFAMDLAWLEDRERIWTEQRLRIGVLGITSSGKSTLVNALMDKRLLPDAVRPSSNTLVLCRWGATHKGTVHFLDTQRPAETTSGEDLSTRLRHFADEESNPGNREGVKEIVIESPEYRLGKDIVVVDTPGLDAYGLMEHEKLTLDVLLPTVDLVLFVTTCKANSDARIAEYVGKAVEYRKPVIVAQNMIDSIAPKLDHRGEVVSSWSDVARAHARRVQRLMEGRGAGAGALVQVSAQWALQGRLGDSRLAELVEVMHRQAEALRSEVTRGRLRQLHVWLTGLVSKELLAEDPARMQRQCRSELESLSRANEAACQRYENYRRQAASASAELNAQADALLSTIGRLQVKDVDKAAQARDAVEKWLRHSPTAPSKLWRETQKAFTEDCDRLNLRAEDVDFAAPTLHFAPPGSFDTVEREKMERKAQDGFWGGFKRTIDIFGADWGYDESRSRWTEIADLGEFKSRMAQSVGTGLKQIDSFLALLRSRATDCMEAVSAASASQRATIEMRMRSLADAQTRRRVAQELARTAASVGHAVGDVDAAVGMQVSHAEDMEMCDVTSKPAAVSLVRLATLVARQRFVGLRNDRLSRVSPDVAGRVLIAGFDRGAVEDFTARYWFDAVTRDGHVEGGALSREIAVAPLDDAGTEQSATLVKRLGQRGAAAFLIVDAHQIGATHNQLHRCRTSIPELFGPRIRKFLVIQSIRELIVSDQFAAGLWELCGMVMELGLAVDGVLANDDSVLYSDLADTLVTGRWPMATLHDEMDWLSARRLDDEDKAVATGALREWRALASGRSKREVS